MDIILRKLSIFSSFSITVLGLIGHFLTALVYSRKKFRSNSAHVNILCLGIIDSIFLLVHLFEDTLRTFLHVYLNNLNSTTDLSFIKNIIYIINLTDNNDTACRTINYLRYSLRFISAYTIVGFTIQRYFITKSPLESKLNTKKASWLAFIIISMASLGLNLWVPFLFGTHEKQNYCDINKNYSNVYSMIAVIFILTNIMIAAIIIIVLNILIIKNTRKADIKGKKLQSTISKSSLSDICKINSNLIRANNVKMSSSLDAEQSQALQSSKILIYHSNFDNLANKIKRKTKNTKKMTKILLLLSFSYVILNFPYFVTLLCIFIRTIYEHDDEINKYLFSLIQIFEIFYILHHSICFYVNWASNKVFRSQLKRLFSRNFNAPKYGSAL